jgi:hypothetical protein
MSPDVLHTVAALRLAVGALGEHSQPTWWPSAFLSPSSKYFLTPVFPKATVLAQCRGVTHAAARIHDERIGVGSVFHLFRLPEEIEQSLHRLLERDEQARRISAAVNDRAVAAASRKSFASGHVRSVGGPVRVGRVADISIIDSWRAVAAHYSSGFESSAEVFPFFSAT